MYRGCNNLPFVTGVPVKTGKIVVLYRLTGKPVIRLPYLELLPRDVEDHVLDVVLRDRDEVEHVVAHQVHLHKYIYRVTIQVVSNLPLTSKQKFRFSMRSLF